MMAVEVALLVNCTGPSVESTLGAPLMQGLLEMGWRRWIRSGWGCGRGAARCSMRARAAPGLLAVGPLRRGELWETMAIPEIRAQAEKEAAERILARVAVEGPASESERGASARR